jgi:hypothetical protein
MGLLDVHGNLRLVSDLVTEDNALCLALACRPLRDAVWARFPQLPAGHQHAGRRLQTPDRALVCSVARLIWGRELPGAPAWLATWRRSAGAGVICSRIAATGQLRVMRWACSQGCRVTASTCTAAARGGHIEMLRFIASGETGRSEQTAVDMWTAKACLEAAGAGHLEVLRWLRSADETEFETGALIGEFPFLDEAPFYFEDAAATAEARAADGSRPARRCPWDWRVCEAAACSGHVQVLDWALLNGAGALDTPEWNPFLVVSGVCRAAAGAGQLELLRWLIDEADHPHGPLERLRAAPPPGRWAELWDTTIPDVIVSMVHLTYFFDTSHVC